MLVFQTSVLVWFIAFYKKICYNTYNIEIKKTIRRQGPENMTIHHDKAAYGKLASLNEEFSQERLEEMTKKLNETEVYGEQYRRMIAGELYDPSDSELASMRKRVRKLFKQYNDSDEDDTKQREELLREMFGKCGQRLYCEPPLRFDYGCNTEVGEDFYANFNLVILDCAPVRIGKQCFIGPNVTIATPVHPLLSCDRNMRRADDGHYYDLEYAKPITIGDNVWLASGVIICGGVTIGHDTVIGAGSIVTRDIPAGVFAAGDPCRVIRELRESDKMQLPLR